MQPLNVTRMRLERIADERARTQEKIEDILALAEEETRELNEYEETQATAYRTQVVNYDAEIEALSVDLERAEKSRDVSKLIRVGAEPEVLGSEGGPVVYRTFAAYAKDILVVRDDKIALAAAGGVQGSLQVVREQAMDRLQRVEHTLTSDVQGLLPPQHLAQILDVINGSRPLVASARHVDLSNGKLTYPKIAQRPEVLKQGTEKTEAGTANMQVTMEDINADTYLGGGNLSWQTINWSSPAALQLWFDLAAEAYARQTETAACAELEGAAGTSAVGMGTVSPALGTSGTESFGAWRAAAFAGAGAIYSQTGGRAQTDTLYLAATRFFQLAGLGTDQVLQVSSVGSLDIKTLTGRFAGLSVVGSYGFSDPDTAILGDSQAFLVGETPGAPVEMRAVEPAIGGLEVGVIGAFQSKVFDTDRFIRLS